VLSPLALLLADARTPSGSYAHSGGLEAAVQSGLRDPDDIVGFLNGRLHTVARVEAAVAAAAVRAARRLDLGALAELDDEAVARCPSPPLRHAASALGRALLRAGTGFWPEAPALVRYRSQSSATPRPVALGVLGAAAALQPRDLAVISLYDDLAGVASAAVKLLPIDSVTALSWVVAMGPDLERAAGDAAAPRPAAALWSASSVLVDLRSVDHRTNEGRLFVT
jgi:urease accessory protein